MKFKVGRASKYSKREDEVELNSLEDLIAFCHEVDEEVIINAKGQPVYRPLTEEEKAQRDEEWSERKAPFKPSLGRFQGVQFVGYNNEPELLIYDDYIE